MALILNNLRCIRALHVVSVRARCVVIEQLRVHSYGLRFDSKAKLLTFWWDDEKQQDEA